MQKIDSHQHFWIYDPVKDSWITPEMEVIKHDFMPGDLKPLLEQHQVSGCIAVQADQSEQETLFLLDLAAHNPFIKAVVGWVDLQADDIEERLTFFSKYSQIKGFRHIIEAEPDPDFLLNEKFKNGIAKLAKYQFSYDLLLRPIHLPAAIRLVKEFPDQAFVIDHLAKPEIRSQKMADWEKDIKHIARYPNVYCKVSGFCTEANWLNWRREDITPYLDVVFTSFGPNRVMFGSDWPVCLLAGGYAKTIEVLEDYLTDFPHSAQENFWNNNAATFYRISD
ncbi:amidohydrolase family protein [Mucilaginibacter jinjuensis]|uniref:Amidohydrolase family protein n=1 Tax=Mucilaginibacter jinjuensis TaxID=1176721 RepID=A0ABY7TG09_9SPHI|nr:amidohydrolase family protein [Mucilaginibacter jinjuensis]WCT14092.1 amidohydrolase family protein [Mucilaginibacter jinjuensis]